MHLPTVLATLKVNCSIDTNDSHIVTNVIYCSC